MARTRTLLALLAAALLTAGCASQSSGYSRVDAHQVVLIPGGRTGAGETALACGARAEAARLHERLRVARPARPTPSAQILTADLQTALKPGAIVIAPISATSLQAPIESMRRAGIHVVTLHTTAPGGHAAREGARAVARATAAIRGTLGRGDGMGGSIPPATVGECVAHGD